MCRDKSLVIQDVSVEGWRAGDEWSAAPGAEREAVLPEEVVVVRRGVEEALQQGVQRVRLARGHRVAVPPVLLQFTR